MPIFGAGHGQVELKNALTDTLAKVRTLTIKALKSAIKTADEKLVFDADKISVPKDEKKESLIQTLVDRFVAAGVEDVRKYAKAVDPQEANVPPAVQAAVVPQTQVQRAAREVLILEGMWCCVCVCGLPLGGLGVTVQRLLSLAVYPVLVPHRPRSSS